MIQSTQALKPMPPKQKSQRELFMDMNTHSLSRDLGLKLVATALFMLLYVFRSAINEYMMQAMIHGFWTFVLLEFAINLAFGLTIGLFFRENIHLRKNPHQHQLAMGLLLILSLACKLLYFAPEIGTLWGSKFMCAASYPQLALGMYLFFYGQLLWEGRKKESSY